MNKRRAKKLSKWVNYLCGFSGTGPTLLDTKPTRGLSPSDKRFLNRPDIKQEIEQEKDRRWQAWRKASIEILGEDPDDEF